jgi:tetratricopeptide (TPR) repeat protein
MVDYDRATELDSELATPYIGRGAIRFEQGRYQESIDHYSTALKLDPRLLQAMRFRGYAFLAIGKDDEADRDFSRVLAVAPAFREEIETGSAQIRGKRKQ